jgi:nucleoside 2-deoxyribosyltransferase
MGDKTNIYFAAALFSGRETGFNLDIAGRLEEKYDVFLPQRDGFEFGRLANSLKGKVNPGEISSIVQNVIYFYDMGVQLPKGDVVVANLDEPIDDGVIVEVCYAKLMSKPVIGFRTDVRSPYGSVSDPLKGMHFFPAYQCDFFIPHYMPAKNRKEAEDEKDRLVDKIDGAIGRSEKSEPNYHNPVIKSILDCAQILFGGLEDYNSDESLETIASRYINIKKVKVAKIEPEILK